MSRESKVLIGVGGLAVIGLILALSGQHGPRAAGAGRRPGRRLRRAAADQARRERSVRRRPHRGRPHRHRHAHPERAAGPVVARGRPQRLDPAGRSGLAAGRADLRAPASTPRPRAAGLRTARAPVLRSPGLRRSGLEAPAYEAPASEPGCSRAVAEAEPAAPARGTTGWDSTVTWDPEAEPAVQAPDSVRARAAAARRPPARRQPARRPGRPRRPRPHRRGRAHREPRGGRADAPPDFSPLGVGLRRRRHPRQPASTRTSPTPTTSWRPARRPSSTSPSGEQTELQKLLAKVQIRLSAYE